MKTSAPRLVLGAAALLAVLTVNARAGLIHRYDFTADAKDLVGTADGTLEAGAGIADGQAVLDGSAAYVNFPNNLLTNLDSITMEAWVIDYGSAGWARLWDFGNSVSGEDAQGGGAQYMFMSLPSGNGNLRGAYTITGGGSGEQIVEWPGGRPEVGVEAHVVWTSDAATHIGRLYVNGILVGENLNVTLTPKALGPTFNDWLGRSQFNDPFFNGSIDEFRIYDSALSSLETAASFISGPDKPSTDAAVLGALQAVHFAGKTTLTQGDKVGTAATADFAKLSGVSMNGVAGLAYQSSDTKVVSVSATGELTAAGAGSATVTATYQGKSDSFSVAVSRREGIAVAGTLYVDLRARDFVAGAVVWTNRAGFGDFDMDGSPALVANVAGTGIAGVQFNGTTDAFLGRDNTTADLDGGSDRSMEVWVYNPAVAGEETLVAWGHRGTTLRNMSFNYGSNGDYGSAGHWGADMGWKGTPAAGTWHYLVYTYDGTTSRVYADGALKNQANLKLDTFPTEPIRIGAQGNTTADGFDFGQALSGYIALARVHGGALSDQDIVNNYLYGSDLTSPGALQAVKIQVGSAPILVDGFIQAQVLADYANRSNFNVTGFVTLQSSDTNIATVNQNGLIATRALGTVTLTTSYQGMPAAQTVQVVAGSPAVLTHRYSFNDATTSTTAKDSVGTANGTLNGGATLSGTEVALNGTDGYVDLPNGIISSMTNTTFEAWVTWNGPIDSPWQRIFDFGSSSGGEDQQGGGVTYLYLTPNSGGGFVQFAPNDGSGETPVLVGPKRMDMGVESYAAMVYNYSAHKVKIFVNGQVVSSGQATIPLKSINDINNWIGRSQYNDPWYNGTINEFRIYDGALTDAQIADSFAAGPNTLPVVSKPILKAAQVNGAFVITWPVDSAGFTLQSTPVLGQAAQWTPVSEQPTVENGQNKVTIATSDAVRFYQLKK